MSSRGEKPLDTLSIADALGISTVQVNRELQQLEHEGLIRPGIDATGVLDSQRLVRFCAFDVDYLHQDGDA